MDCPNCKNQILEPVALEQGLVAAGCQNCLGALLPLMNYRYWVDHSHTLAPLENELVIESGGAKICPKCNKLMSKYLLGADSQNRIDLCVHCDEVWLDAGEWVLIKKMNLQDVLPKVFTDAWQRNIRHQRQVQKINQHYIQLLGQHDFDKMEDFKAWLDSHEHAAEIKHYVTAKFD